jgi:hypothetical protein
MRTLIFLLVGLLYDLEGHVHAADVQEPASEDGK